ncbi:MAG: metallophosphoesterase [Acidobacteriota bacterium]
MLILHLSDLHFGQHSRFADFTGAALDRLAEDFRHNLQLEQKNLDLEGQIDVVIVTGDFAEQAKPKEFRQAESFLGVLAQQLGVERRRFVFVPGNHDVSWPKCKQVEADQEIQEFDDYVLRRRMDEVKLVFYDDFVKRFYDVDDLDLVARPLDRGAYLHDFRDLQLSVVAANSCELESHRSEDHRGFVSDFQAQTIMNAWRTVDNRIKILAVHHNPAGTVQANKAWWREQVEAGKLDGETYRRLESDLAGFDGAEALKAIVADARCHLVLHGHHHARDEAIWGWRDEGQAYVLSAGSLTLTQNQLPKDEPISFRLLHLDRPARRFVAFNFEWSDLKRVEGKVRSGGFFLDPAEPDGYRKALVLPSGFAADSDDEQGTDSTELAAFERSYRNAYGADYSRWDLGNVGAVHSTRDARLEEAALDYMYVPLRLDERLDRETDHGAPITVDDLLARERPLVIRGGAGSGKTTWMRYTFRQLLSDKRTLPIMLELRRLARVWSIDQGSGKAMRSLESFLDEEVSSRFGSSVPFLLCDWLGTTPTTVPVLLVDGWDEVGDLGEELRKRLLGLMKAHTDLRVVVTSRPYGEGRPSDGDNFDVLDVQPLADDEIELLSKRFFGRCHGEDARAVERDVESFDQAVNRSAEAKDLARTPLLLTMMLLLSRSEPLPDKRHLLYERCIWNLLNNIPQRKESTGARGQLGNDA